MSQRRHNEDRTRTASEDILKMEKIGIAIAPALKRIEAELKIITTIKENLAKIVVFLAIL